MSIYRGGIGQWSWVAHRITGVGVLVFLVVHIVDTALIMLGPEAYNHVMSIYRHPLFRLSEIGLFASVLFHALNGLRILLIDFWPRLARLHRQLFLAEMAVFVAAMIPVTYLMVKPLLAAR